MSGLIDSILPCIVKWGSNLHLFILSRGSVEGMKMVYCNEFATWDRKDCPTILNLFQHRLDNGELWGLLSMIKGFIIESMSGTIYLKPFFIKYPWPMSMWCVWIENVIYRKASQGRWSVGGSHNCGVNFLSFQHFHFSNMLNEPFASHFSNQQDQ